jgi:hypothetical protein
MTCTCDMHGTSYLHCGACHRSFLSLTAFDAHQDVDYSRRPAVECRDPASLGMTPGGTGVWGTPEGHARREATSARFAAVRSRQLARSAEQPSPVLDSYPRVPEPADSGGAS